MPNASLLSSAASGKEFGLMPIEKQFIALTAAGYSWGERKKTTGMSGSALRMHMASICDKLSISNELELILFALYHHLIDEQ